MYFLQNSPLMTQYEQVHIVHVPTLQQSASRWQGENNWASVRIETKPDETYIFVSLPDLKSGLNCFSQLSNNILTSGPEETSAISALEENQWRLLQMPQNSGI